MFLSAFFFLFLISDPRLSLFFFFNDPAPPEIYPLSLHDALPISYPKSSCVFMPAANGRWPMCSTPEPIIASWTPAAISAAEKLTACWAEPHWRSTVDRKSTRLNSSHSQISYAVFCLKKKNLVLRDKLRSAHRQHRAWAAHFRVVLARDGFDVVARAAVLHPKIPANFSDLAVGLEDLN